MKKLQVVLTGIILLFVMQFTLVSCEDNSEIILSKDVEQVQNEVKMVVPSHAGGDDDDENYEGN